ncbi:hypothetical protein ZIOFF_020825 [Zingiber officinale]|uniref:Uncharacterized protein n=1 Tax=Zingiber officinale TaxID=94328 RepID=A0A8J5H2Y0_ZINOF|nr:hypothetical protein ZIOFF_020825 [Zingiber officinale]
MFQENCEWTWNAGANNEEKVPKFMVVDTFDTDKVILAANIEVGAEDVTTPTIGVVPMTRASSPSTPSSNTHAASSPSITNSPESYEGPVCFRSIADIYTNTEEVVGIDEEEGEVMMMIFEEPTCYQEAATEACCLASELTGVKSKPVTLFVDNKSAITLMKNPVFHGRSKRIDTKFHFIKECVEKGQIMVEFVNIGERRADVLTKALPEVKLAVMRQLLDIRDLEPRQD